MDDGETLLAKDGARWRYVCDVESVAEGQAVCNAWLVRRQAMTRGRDGIATLEAGPMGPHSDPRWVQLEYTICMREGTLPRDLMQRTESDCGGAQGPGEGPRGANVSLSDQAHSIRMPLVRCGHLVGGTVEAPTAIKYTVAQGIGVAAASGSSLGWFTPDLSRRLWSIEPLEWASPVCGGGTVYYGPAKAGGDERHLLAVDAANGRIKARQSAPIAAIVGLSHNSVLLRLAEHKDFSLLALRAEKATVINGLTKKIEQVLRSQGAQHLAKHVKITTLSSPLPI